MELTHKKIAALKYNKARSKNQQQILWDRKIPGFGARIYPSGKKKYVIFYYTKGKRRCETIANCNVMSVEMARDEAKRILLRHNHMQTETSLITFKTLSNKYFNLHAKKHHKTWLKNERRVEKYLIPIIGHMPAKAITGLDFVKIHSDISFHAPYQANRVIEIASSIYSRAIRWGVLDYNPAKAVDHNRERKRDRFVLKSEMPRLVAALEEESNKAAVNAIKLLLFTGMRKNEILCAKWQDVNFDKKTLFVKDTKSGRPLHQPLIGPAIELLKSIEPLPENPYIIPGAIKGKHLVNLDKPWYRIRTKAGLEDVQIHDLRRTVGSWLAQSGYSLNLIGQVLNHSSVQSTQVYSRFTNDSLQEALETYGDELMEYG